jgi:hypothetical protein
MKGNQVTRWRTRRAGGESHPRNWPLWPAALCLLLLLPATSLARQAGSAASPLTNPFYGSLLPREPALTQEESAPEEEASESPVGNFELTYGLNQRFRPRNNDEGARVLRGPLSLSVVLHPRVFLEVGTDTFVSVTPRAGDRVTGFGDTNVGAFFAVANEGEDLPASIGFFYSLKIPTASVSKGLGSGRADHLILTAVGKNVGEKGKVEVDFGGYFAGRPGEGGFTTTGLLTLFYQRSFGRADKFTFRTQFDGASRTEDVPSEISSINWVQMQLNSRTAARLGAQVGVTPNAPRFGLFGALIFSGNFRKIF